MQARQLRTQFSGEDRKFLGLSNRQTFEKIYDEKLWGAGVHGAPFSGAGSHSERVISEYIAAVNGFIESLGSSVVIVDLGCGDFNVGNKIAEAASCYIGCDIVPSVIQYNTEKYLHDGHIEFRVLDLVEDILPVGDVVIVRQVLQHLCNDDIERFVLKLNSSDYSYLILTEHVPAQPFFTSNVDKISGASIRAAFGSGVDLSKKPFGLKYLSSEVLCEVPEDISGVDAVIRTILYKLK